MAITHTNISQRHRRQTKEARHRGYRGGISARDQKDFFFFVKYLILFVCVYVFSIVCLFV